MKSRVQGPWPPRFLICRCGEAFERNHPHQCRSKLFRIANTPELYRRWMDRRVAAEIEEKLHQLGQDPAFAPGTEQREFLDR